MTPRKGKTKHINRNSSSHASNATKQNKTTRNCKPSHDHSYNSLYFRYKKSTQQFVDQLQLMVPPEIFKSSTNVSTIAEAADYIDKHNIKVENSLLVDLQTCLQVRKRIARTKYNGGDEGHTFFISILDYCWIVLKRQQSQKQTLSKLTLSVKDSLADQNAFYNRFSRFSLDNDIDNDNEDEEVTKLNLFPWPQLTPELTVKEILLGTDRQNIILFLLTLDELMTSSVSYFADLNKLSIVTNENYDLTTALLVEKTIQASVNSNMVIEEVASLEAVFALENPHLNTIYRMLTPLTLMNLITDLTELVMMKSPIASKFKEYNAIVFLGDVMECGFRSLFHRPSEEILLRFIYDWKIIDSYNEIDKICSDVYNEILREAPCYNEITTNKSTTLTSHTWLKEMSYLSGNRSIIHTIRLLQMLPPKSIANPKNYEYTDYWGVTEWDDTIATQIQIDMDHVLVSDILPSLFSMCNNPLQSRKLELQDQLLTGFVHIKSFIKYPNRPVTWAVAFTIQIIATSIFEIKAPSQLTLFAERYQSTFFNYFEQLKTRQNKTSTSSILHFPSGKVDNIKRMLILQYLPCIEMETSRQQILLSRWNPYCAGTCLSYIAYCANLEGGKHEVNSIGQLLVTLHLYNALKQLGAIQMGEIKFLDYIFEIFKNCKAIWTGSIPTPREFQKRFWIAYGMTIEFANYVCNVNSSEGDSRNTRWHKFQRTNLWRVKPSIEVTQLSHSFSKICRRTHDYTEDKHSSQKQNNDFLFSKHEVHVIDTMNAISQDLLLLSINLPSLGFHLDLFFRHLFDTLGDMVFIDEVATKCKDMRTNNKTKRSQKNQKNKLYLDTSLRYLIMTYSFGHNILSQFDCGNQILINRCAEFMRLFFHDKNNIDMKDIMWF